MGKGQVGRWVLALGVALGVLTFLGTGTVALAAESLNIEGLPADQKVFRKQVDLILKKVDELIEKLKGKKNATAITLDLIQTRDNVLREVPKVESVPDGAKWGQGEARASVEAMLKLLKDQYEKGSSLAG